ncbi:MAG: hypothetical protein HQL57_00590 [Magnetococcales bacterium]|nr:hypothetical protein [Magnetococcales bacterium]
MFFFQFRETEVAEPDLEAVCRRYGLTEAEVDPRFGVVATDSRDRLYTILVTAEAASRLRKQLTPGATAADPAVGIFANPEVEPLADAEAPDPKLPGGNPFTC